MTRAQHLITVISSIATVFLVGCSESSEASSKADQKDSTQTDQHVITDSFIGQANDTLHQNRTTEFFHAIYIERNQEAKAFQRLLNFDFDDFEREANRESYREFNKRFPASNNKVDLQGLPEQWLPVFLYQNQFFLYAPCDWGNARRRIISDSAVINWYMDGPMPFPILGFHQPSATESQLRLINPFNPPQQPRTLTITELDAETGLSVWSYDDQASEFQLYVPLQSAAAFELIVNHCEKNKQLEFEFDDVSLDSIRRVLANNPRKK